MAPVVKAHATKGLAALVHAAKAKLAKALVAWAHVAKAHAVKAKNLMQALAPVLHVFSGQPAL